MGAIEKAEGHGYDSKTKVWRSKRESISVPEDEMFDVIEWLHQRTPDGDVGDKRAMVDATTSEQFTDREFKENFQTLAAGLSELGIKHGDVVLLLSPNSVWIPVISFGVMRLGGIITRVNPISTTEEILKQVQDFGALYAITTQSLYPKLESIGLPTIFIGAKPDSLPKNTIPFSTLLAADRHKAPRVRRRQSDTAAILYSSGTTGLSKEVVLSHKNFISVTMQLHLEDPLDIRERRYVGAIPMFHTYGLAAVVLGQITRGGEVSSGAAPLGKDLTESLHQRCPSWRIRQVAPAELEALLLTHPQIRDAAVIPKPDKQAGQVPIAYVVRTPIIPRLPKSILTEKQVIAWVARQVSPYKRIHQVTFIDAIPKSASGKILRRELVNLEQSKL